MSSANQSLVTAVVDGRPLGVFDTLSGGETAADISKRRAGGGVQRTYTNGKRDTSDVTITRDYDRDRDVELARWLRTRVGRAFGSVNDQPLDDDDVAWGKPTVFTGRLQSVNTGDVDSDSGDPRMLSLTFSINEAN